MHVPVLTLALASTALAGFVGFTDDPEPTALPPVDLGTLSADGATVPAADGVRWTGGVLTGPHEADYSIPALLLCALGACEEPEVDCTETNCDVRKVLVEVPEGRDDLVLEASVRWPTDLSLLYALEIQDAGGSVVAKGESAFIYTMARTALVADPTPGVYKIVVKAVTGEGPYEAIVQIEADIPAEPVRQLLPDLVTLPPTDLQIRAPDVQFVGYTPVLFPPATGVLGGLTDAPGCTFEEAALLGAKRCLRFSNLVGNVGEGPLEVHLPLANGAQLATGAQFVQYVYSSDGSYEEVPGGPGEFHVLHGHWHNAANNQYLVYEYDLDTATRGAQIGEGHKPGVCFADIGLVDLGLPFTVVPRFDGSGCIDPLDALEWWTGLSQNWYDSYPWLLTEQYVELGDAPDGVYQLCSSTNAEGTLTESDLANNEACAVFRLTGNDVEVLSEEPYHKMVADPDFGVMR